MSFPPAGVVAAWLARACADDELAVLRTRTPGTPYARRVDLNEVAIIAAAGVRVIAWPIAARPSRAPRARARVPRARTTPTSRLLGPGLTQAEQPSGAVAGSN